MMTVELLKLWIHGSSKGVPDSPNTALQEICRLGIEKRSIALRIGDPFGTLFPRKCRVVAMIRHFFLPPRPSLKDLPGSTT